ncbi:MAG: PQQ-like beta-propeller repeat protein [Planctomycetales bacterium]|nr:PQQ-like beta-propeller repeat protein [Planctomycetales bacterium]
MRSTQQFLAILLASISATTFAADWPQYRGIHGDGKSTETIADVNWESTPPSPLWKIETPLGFSSFSIANGIAVTLVAVGDDGAKKETCIAVDVASGDELWRASFGDSEYGHDGGNSGASDNRGGDGPRSTPSCDGEHVYVYDSHMLLTCLNAKNGEIIWQRDVLKDYEGEDIKWKNASSPVLDANNVYVGGGGDGQSFLAFNKSTGELVWKSGDETITHATPTLASINGQQQLVYFTQFGLVSVNAGTGSEIWRCKFPFSVSTAASPIVDNNLVYCSAGYGVGAGLFDIKGSEAEEIWFQANKLMNHWSTPIVHDGHLYGIFEFKKYGSAPLNCVDLKTGEIKWSQRGFGPGNCILADEKLIVLSDAGEVAIVAAKPDEYTELARAKVLNGKCWSTPALSNGKLIVRSTEEAVCLDVSP